MTKHKYVKLAFFPVMLIMALSCSEPYPPIDRLTAEDLAAMAAMSSSSTESSSSGEEQKITVSGVSQKGPFVNGSDVTISELDGNLAFTGRNFPSTITDDKGSFEIEARLVSPYVRLEASGYYRNEVTGGNNEQIALYAIADITDKNSVNINILTHLEYERVRVLTGEGKSLKDAKKQAQGEILSVFGINGSSFKNSEDMSIFGTSESDAALLAVSVLLQGGLGAGDFTARLSDFSQSLKNAGTWSEARKAELTDWASGADLGAIRGNILGWGLSSGVVPDFGKYVYSYWVANYGLGVCNAFSEGSQRKNGNALSAKKDVYYICLGNEWQEDKCVYGSAAYSSETQFCRNNVIYDKCGDRNGNGKHEYDPEIQFCNKNNSTTDKCGGNEYNPPEEECRYGVVGKLCGSTWYDPLKYYCYNGELRSCGNLPLNPDTHFCLGSTVTPLCGGETFTSSQFCYNNNIENKCGGTVTFTPGTEDCCGNNKYTLATHSCYNGQTYSCNNQPYNPSTQFCLGNTVTPLCGGETFTSSQFCSGNDILNKCGGTVTFAPGTEDCCGNDKYTLATHSCYNGQTYSCGNQPYNPSTHFCHNGQTYSCNNQPYNPSTHFCHNGQTYSCNNQPYNPSTQFCLGNTVTPLCGGETFTSSQFCSGNDILNKCGGTVTFAPGTEDCCGNDKYTLATHSCYNGQTYSCNNQPYNPSTHFCLGSTVTPLCGGETFTGSQFCSGNDILNKCGGTVTFTPGTEDCCGNNKYTLATHFCYNGQTYSCGNQPYNPSTHFCYNGIKGEYCGNRTVEYNPDLYKCKPEININGIYLIAKPQDLAGKKYEAVLIGTQTWLAENLNYDVPDNTTDVCIGDLPANCTQYGRLYNWATAMNNASSSTAVPSGVRGVCPEGWHLPSREEWNALSSYVRSTSGCTSCDAKLLKAESGWNSNGNGTDAYGFSALPGGNGYSGYFYFFNVGDRGLWWSASESSSDGASCRDMLYNGESASWGSNDKSYLYSVRCVED